MNDVVISNRRGALHFLRFPTSEIINLLELVRIKGIVNFVTTVSATGGGAYKFEKNFIRVNNY